MVDALQDIVNNIEQRIDLRNGDIVLDIGCNDGTLLSQYSNKKLYKIGFDPAENLALQAQQHCNSFYNTYFGDPEIFILNAKAITSIAMFYDLEDPHTFVELVKHALHPEGIWVIQLSDVLSMLQARAFDAICHEHLEYYSLQVLKDLMEAHKLKIFDVLYNDVNGGSIRAYVSHKNQRDVTPAVEAALQREQRSLTPEAFTRFASQVEEIKQIVQEFLDQRYIEGKTVFAMGASTKGNTLLQYFGWDETDIPYAAEVNEDKFGKRTVGTNIPIISEAKALELNPDYFVVLPWHFIDMLVKVHTPYLRQGGKLFVPLPWPTVYEMVKGELQVTCLFNDE
jgi:SAM-dependent methyltransferase